MAKKKATPKKAKKATTKKAIAKKATAKKAIAKKATAKKAAPKTGKKVDWASVVRSVGKGLSPAAPATEAQLKRLNKYGKVPDDLRAFLLVSNGLENRMGDALVTRVSDIVLWTDETRENYADWKDVDVSQLLVVGNWLGSGDFYCYDLSEKEPKRIYFFDHETAKTMLEADDLFDLIERHGH